ncbi:MAG: transposase [Aestuariivirga sp.]
MPSPAFALKGRNSDPGVTNVRNTASPHWRRWLDVDNRCVVPFTSFSENEALPDGTKPPVWFAFDETRLLVFCGCVAVMHADEATRWDKLHEGWQAGRINHSEAYWTQESCANQVESDFSRFRRMSSSELASEVARLAIAHKVSRKWKGNWQRNA